MKTMSEVKVLVVEDDPFFQRILTKRLAAEGYQVLAASDGREGMKVIVTHEPDLVISDWMMPEVDGLELCQSVKTGLREAAPYFILLTAKGEISDKLLGLQTGADDYLVKPCDQAELMARVRAGLRIVLLTQDLRHAVADLQEANSELESARAEVLRLEGMRSICTHCNKVGDAAGHWQELDQFLRSSGSAEIDRGLCPECRAAQDVSLEPEGAEP